MAHFTLRQAQGVLQRERTDVEEEQTCLLKWGSLLKERTTSEKGETGGEAGVAGRGGAPARSAASCH
jgi:hypothetical protein